MVSKRYYLIACFVCFSLVGCSTPNHLEFDEAFELSSFLKTHIRELTGQKVEFQILNQHGEAIPFALLKFEWIEGGRISFQTNPNGQLRMEFEADVLEYEIMVSAEVNRSRVRVTW